MSFELSRPQAVAVREFVPGNKLYANGGSYRAGRFHFPVTGQRQRVDTYVADLETGFITSPGQPVPENTNGHFASSAIAARFAPCCRSLRKCNGLGGGFLSMSPIR